MKIFITGGAGFIGSTLIKHLIMNTAYEIVNIDKLTYAGNTLNLKEIENNKKYKFNKLDINNRIELSKLFETEKPDAIVNLAAESHVDRSIFEPADFIKSNILGTYNLLEVVRKYLKDCKKSFKFLHVSTDEVFGDLGLEKKPCTEEYSYKPSSPYSASKASSDHLVRAWGRTYDIPTIITNCSNNYGPYQYPEKLIPLTINNIISRKKIPIYGDGLQSRDWLFVEDHAKALGIILEKGKIGETYNISGNYESSNLSLVKKICEIIERNYPDKFTHLKNLISFVEDRKGHDVRYALNSNKLRSELKWMPQEDFLINLEKTIEWYFNNQKWCKEILK